MTKKTTQKYPLTLHALLVALSFWGTAVRTLLFSFLAVAVFLVALTEAATPAAVDNEVMTFIYVIGSFLLLDFGYVMVARAYILQKGLDVLALLIADILLALLYIAPKIVVSPGVVLKTSPLLYVIFIPIIAIGMRILLGMLFGRKQR
jgi:hypothetical protein